MILFSSHRRAYLYIVLGAALWGTIGFYIDWLSEAGFTSLQIVTLRVTSASILLVGYLLIKDRKKLSIKWRDSASFIGTGIFSVVFFNWCYFTAIKEVSLSVAVILLYTGPAFVAVMSWMLFNEPMTRRKVLALILTLSGCILVVELIPLNEQSVSLYGIVVGLGSGFGYALYSIFGKYALRKYSTITIITYTFVFASLALIPFSETAEIAVKLMENKMALLVVLGLGILPTALAYLLYTLGLSAIESSRASITATVEPVVAAIIGVTVFQEVLAAPQILGMILVLSAVVLIQLKRRTRVPVS